MPDKPQSAIRNPQSSILRLNIGCGSTAPAPPSDGRPGWVNIDNSPTVWLAQRRWLWWLARRLGIVPADMAEAPRWARYVLVADATRPGLRFRILDCGLRIVRQVRAGALRIADSGLRIVRQRRASSSGEPAFAPHPQSAIQNPQSGNPQSAIPRPILPFPDGAAAVIYASHFLEHLTQEEAGRFLVECHRLLRPGGILRLVVPDLAYLISLYQQARRGERLAISDWRLEWVALANRQSLMANGSAADALVDNLWMVDKGLARYPAWFRPLKALLRSDVHRWMYDEASLTRLLRERGFIQIRPRGYLESEIPGLAEVESPKRLEGAVCLEALRPKAQ